MAKFLSPKETQACFVLLFALCFFPLLAFILIVDLACLLFALGLSLFFSFFVSPPQTLSPPPSKLAMDQPPKYQAQPSYPQPQPQGEHVVLLQQYHHTRRRHKYVVQLAVLTPLSLVMLAVAYFLSVYALVWEMVVTLYSHFLITFTVHEGVPLPMAIKAWLVGGYVLVAGGFGMGVACLGMCLRISACLGICLGICLGMPRHMHRHAHGHMPRHA